MRLWFIILVVSLGVYINTPKLIIDLIIPQTGININNFLDRFPLKLGLDLQGGIQLVLQTDMEKIDYPDRDTAHEAVREAIERRVNLFGVSESLVQTSKLGDSRRIVVELPGVQNASAAANLVGKTAQLEFHEFESSPSAESSGKPTGLTGKHLKKAAVTFGQSGGISGPQVAIEFTSEGAAKFAEITKRNIGKPLGMYLDGLPISWPPPTVNQEILGGSAVITGHFTAQEARSLAIQLNAGALPVPVHILQQRLIGPTLGSESVSKSLVAGAIGITIVMVYMVAFYGSLGVLADLALVIYTILVLAIFRTGGFIFPPITLTLAGIAGLILSIGMAVDANILIFERMKEELRWGKSKVAALNLGFERAWSSIWASNVSSLMTAAILYIFGTSIVRGFAVTLGIGVLVSMFTAIVVTRTFLKLIVRTQ